jgi:hypothetical protein
MKSHSMKRIFTLFVLFAGLLSYGSLEAAPTKLVVRAKAKDAKFVGTSMGGARVVVRDAETGKVLAEGLTAGGTGNTRTIMLEPMKRFGRIADGAAKFEATIDIDEPRLVDIDVEAPYIHKDNMIKSSTQIWLIPGRDMAGDGIIIEIPGFSVDAVSPAKATLVNNKAVISIQARIVMI